MQHEKVMSSGTIDETDAETIKEIFGDYEVHLVIKESAPTKGCHFHYMVLHEGTRTAMRNRLIRKLGVKATCVDPNRGNNTWNKGKQYLCKEDPVDVVSRSGIEFSDENLEKYHEKYHEVKEDAKNKRIGKKRMEIIMEECQGCTTLYQVCENVADLYDEQGWPMQEHLMLSQIRSAYFRTPGGRQSVVDGLYSKFTYSEINR